MSLEKEVLNFSFISISNIKLNYKFQKGGKSNAERGGRQQQQTPTSKIFFYF